MNSDKKKSMSGGDSTPKSSHNKSTKSSKSSKSRAKNSKSESSKSNTSDSIPTSSSSSHIDASTASTAPTDPTTPTTPSTPTTPTTPTTSSTPTSSTDFSQERSHQKGYAAFGPKTIKTIWEQHNTGETELAQDLLPILAEDVSYKMWELIKNIKTYSIHSGGSVTSDTVNEVLKDSDCPPVLGPMETEWDRIDYEGSFYFNSDKLIELRSEYQKDVKITMPFGAPFLSTWPIQVGCREMMQSFLQSIFLITLGGTEAEFDSVRQYVYAAPFIGSLYRVLLVKMIQTLAFKQTNHVKRRCWRLMQTLAQHPTCRNIFCREDYFHLAQIFICQLLDTYDSTNSFVKNETKVEEEKFIPMEIDETISFPQTTENEVKLEDIKKEESMDVDKENIKQIAAENNNIMVEEELPQTERIYRLEKDDEDESVIDQMEGQDFSPYTAEQVDFYLVDDLCETIGLIGAMNEFFNTECMHLILIRLERFFQKKENSSEIDYGFISRAIRGLFALGEYAFREFIPFMHNMNILNAVNIPDYLRCEFARGAIFLRGHDDIFLYEWLNEMCSYRLLPFMTHYAQYHQKLTRYYHLKRHCATFKIIPKVSTKRIIIASPEPAEKEESSNLKTKFFPHCTAPVNSRLPISFKFSGCRQIPVKSVNNRNLMEEMESISTSKNQTKGIIIARRKLFKPLTDERRCVSLSNYHLLRI